MKYIITHNNVVLATVDYKRDFEEEVAYYLGEFNIDALGFYVCKEITVTQEPKIEYPKEKS